MMIIVGLCFTGNGGDHSPENNIHHNTQNTLWGNKPMIVRVTLSDPPLLKPLKMLKMLKLVKGGMQLLRAPKQLSLITQFSRLGTLLLVHLISEQVALSFFTSPQSVSCTQMFTSRQNIWPDQLTTKHVDKGAGIIVLLFMGLLWFM